MSGEKAKAKEDKSRGRFAFELVLYLGVAILMLSAVFSGDWARAIFWLLMLHFNFQGTAIK